MAAFPHEGDLDGKFLGRVVAGWDQILAGGQEDVAGAPPETGVGASLTAWIRTQYRPGYSPPLPGIS